ncbi:MAG: hypothetical protein HC898_05295 [Phycisphaerales bacterium]|nr:hypothetical protein [Phycisphaerales bacterium]
MTQIIIEQETEAHQGWMYRVLVTAEGVEYRYQVTLSWAEHDLWSHGRVPPERVVRAAMRFLLDREPAEAILKKFDCAVIRRYFPEVDRELPRLI